LIQEQNSYAGLTNKWLSKRVQAICVAYPGMELYFPADKIHLTGNPVRQDIVALTDQREEALRFFGLSADKPVLLVIGGSQGARSINEAIAAGLPQLLDAGVQVVWQTGKNSFVESEASQNWQAQTGIHRTVFIQEMAKAYTTADVVVSRAGALSVSELCIARKPPIFVPLPTAAEDHQTKNAQALVQANAALLVPNARAATDLLPQTLALLQDKARQAELSQNIAQLARPQAAEAIVETLLGLGR
jgi:UDP-N-acetylglucosamine--N-acetylmuramyl-(pentapeptide) pyrophosphoryl-undecaprenol N-acetylglucosamine transferase